MKRLLMAAALAACTIAAFALPSVDAVRAELAQGHDTRAEQMIREVISARPDSARARYVHAEILAHQGHFSQAADEAAQAKRLDPGLTFTQPESFRTFEAMLARERTAATRLHASDGSLQTAAPLRSGGVPGWVWGGGLALLAAVALSRLGAARQPAPIVATGGLAPAAGSAGAVSLPAPYGMVPSPPSAPASSTSGGLLGTGLAVAGGMAAGALAERLLDRHRESAAGSFWTPAAPPMAFETQDDAAREVAAARALEERPIDLGSGDDWGGADVSSGSTDSSDGW